MDKVENTVSQPQATQGIETAIIVGEGIAAENASWTFSGETAKSFTDHVKRSVPHYELGHELVGQVSDYFVKKDSTCYELGCSTAALLRKLAGRHAASTRWIGVDIEPNMIEQAKKEISEGDKELDNIHLVSDNINLMDYEPSDFIVAYYTVQFIPPRLRQDLINKLYQSLNWGGALVLFEKVRGPDARFQDIASGLYTDFKINQGYTPSEILAKSRSLKGVLEPFSTQGNIDLLKRAGFVDYTTIFKYVCFEGFLAIK